MKDIPSPLQQGNGNVGLGMKYLTQLVEGDVAIKGWRVDGESCLYKQEEKFKPAVQYSYMDN